MKDDLAYALDILEYARRAQRHAAGKGAADLQVEEWLQDAVIRCFEVMGEAAKRVTPEFQTAHPKIPWRKITGFRDVLIHGYDGIDLNICWKVLTDELPPLIASLERILQPET